MSAQKFPLQANLGRYGDMFFSTKYDSRGLSPDMQLFVDMAQEENSNLTYWQQHYGVDQLPVPRQDNGTYPYTVYSTVKSVVPMMDFTADFAETTEWEKGGHSEHTSTVPKLSIGNYDTTMSLLRLQDLIKQYGDDKRLMEIYKNTVNDGINAANYALNRMAAQEQSGNLIIGWKGHGIGLTNPLSGGVPTEQMVVPNVNLQDADVSVFEYIFKYLDEIKRSRPNNINWVLDMSEKFITDVILNNTKDKATLSDYILRNGQSGIIIIDGNQTSRSSSIRVQDVIDYSNSADSMIPRIVLHKENQIENGTGIGTSGWNHNNIVLRPEGQVGIVKWTNIPEIEVSRIYTSPSVPKNFAMALSGIVGIINSVVDNNSFPDFHTDFYMGARTQLTDFQWRYIIQTDKTI